MDSDLQMYKKSLQGFDMDLVNLGWVDDSLAQFLIDETECFEDCPEIDEARALIEKAHDIIKDYQKVQLLWVEEQRDEPTDD